MVGVAGGFFVFDLGMIDRVLRDAVLRECRSKTKTFLVHIVLEFKYVLFCFALFYFVLLAHVLANSIPESGP